ncbi:MAG: RNA polymerase sigma factor [Myxococcota bacterium]
MSFPTVRENAWSDAVARLRRHLYLRHVEPLRAGLRRYCRALAGEDHADDLAQETILRAYRPLTDLSAPVRRPRAFLRRIASNLWRDRRRRKREVLMEVLPEVVAASRPGALEVQEAYAALAERLPPRELEAFVLRELCDYTTREAAQALGISEGALKMATVRARQRLRL